MVSLTYELDVSYLYPNPNSKSRPVSMLSATDRGRRTWSRRTPRLIDDIYEQPLNPTLPSDGRKHEREDGSTSEHALNDITLPDETESPTKVPTLGTWGFSRTACMSALSEYQNPYPVNWSSWTRKEAIPVYQNDDMREVEDPLRNQQDNKIAEDSAIHAASESAPLNCSNLSGPLFCPYEKFKSLIEELDAESRACRGSNASMSVAPAIEEPLSEEIPTTDQEINSLYDTVLTTQLVSYSMAIKTDSTLAMKADPVLTMKDNPTMTMNDDPALIIKLEPSLDESCANLPACSNAPLAVHLDDGGVSVDLQKTTYVNITELSSLHNVSAQSRNAPSPPDDEGNLQPPTIAVRSANNTSEERSRPQRPVISHATKDLAWMFNYPRV